MYGYVKSIHPLDDNYKVRYMTKEGINIITEIPFCPKYEWNEINDNNWRKLSLQEVKDNDLLYIDTSPIISVNGMNKTEEVDYEIFDGREYPETNAFEIISIEKYKKKYLINDPISIKKFIDKYDPIYNLRLAADDFFVCCENVLEFDDAELIHTLFPDQEYYDPKHTDKWKSAKNLLSSVVLNSIINPPKTVYSQLIYSSLTEENERGLFESFAKESSDIVKICTSC